MRIWLRAWQVKNTVSKLTSSVFDGEVPEQFTSLILFLEAEQRIVANPEAIKDVQKALADRSKTGLGRTLQFSPFGQRLRRAASGAAVQSPAGEVRQFSQAWGVTKDKIQ